GRPSFHADLNIQTNYIEDMKVEDLIHFLKSMSESARMALHLRVLAGVNDHHKVEAAFKALALALKQAVTVNRSGIPSTKGLL
ncbi:MAG: hypothetical protein QW462_06355, partial [Candidatus Nezhaarchaeales archaeon]